MKPKYDKSPLDQVRHDLANQCAVLDSCFLLLERELKGVEIVDTVVEQGRLSIQTVKAILTKLKSYSSEES